METRVATTRGWTVDVGDRKALLKGEEKPQVQVEKFWEAPASGLSLPSLDESTGRPEEVTGY